jgi:AraC-like DNA-binding protein
MKEIVPAFEYNLDLFALFMILGIGQGLFLSFVFLFKKDSRQNSNILLGLLLFCLTLTITESFLNYTGYILNVMYLFSATNSLAFTYGPLLFLYIYTQLYGNIKLKWVHLIPFVLYATFYLFYFNLQSNDFKYNIYIYWYKIDLPQISQVIKKDFWFINSLRFQHYYSPTVVIHFGSYLLISLSFIIKYIKSNTLNSSSIKSAHVKWLRNLLIAFIFLYIIQVPISLIIKLSTHNYLSNIALSGILYFISFSYITNSSFFNKKDLAVGQGSKYAKSSLSDLFKEELLDRIIKLMETKALYKDNLFSLSILSKEVGASSNHVSQVINECLGHSFYDFVAVYRITEAKKLLTSDEYKNFTIEQLAYDVGYNSKSAFNASFKKITGKNPSEYRSS